MYTVDITNVHEVDKALQDMLSKKVCEYIQIYTYDVSSLFTHYKSCTVVPYIFHTMYVVYMYIFF